MCGDGIVRKICTKDHPCKKDGCNWQHPEAKLVDSYNDGIDEIDVYECPICGLRFRETIEQ